MSRAIRNYFVFLRRCAGLAFAGDWRYYAWMGLLTVICLLGLNAYCRQFAHGLIVTGMSDEVSWGVYIANFTFLVGVAAAAVMMVIPVYIYKNEDLHDLVIFGELLAVAAILMCLAFVTVDLGRPDRFWHLIPGIGQFNFPKSMLSWDVLVLNGYLLLNVHICGYLLYCRYRKAKPAKWFYIPFVFIAIVWAVSIHTVTAFLYVGLGGRPFWNSAVVGPRFLASAFTAGPALIILAMQVVRRVTSFAPAWRRLSAAGQGGLCHDRRAAPPLSRTWTCLPRHLAEMVSVPMEGGSPGHPADGAKSWKRRRAMFCCAKGRRRNESLLYLARHGGGQAGGGRTVPDYAQPWAGRAVRRRSPPSMPERRARARPSPKSPP
jgi:hypothetical protein